MSGDESGVIDSIPDIVDKLLNRASVAPTPTAPMPTADAHCALTVAPSHKLAGDSSRYARHRVPAVTMPFG